MDNTIEEDPPPSRVVAAESSQRPIPAVRKRRLVHTAVESSSLMADDTQSYVDQGQKPKEFVPIQDNISKEVLYDESSSVQETSTVYRTITKSIKTSSTSSHEFVMEDYDISTPSTPSRLKQKIAVYERGGMKRMEDEANQEGCTLKSYDSQDTANIDISIDSDNPFDVDIQLKAIPQSPARKVEIHEEHTASPFNVTLKTTSKISPGARYRRNPPTPEETPGTSPFNVTLRTTKRQDTIPHSKVMDGKTASARFLEGEKTVREIIAADGVKTIVTSSMTTDGRKHEEKIFRHVFTQVKLISAVLCIGLLRHTNSKVLQPQTNIKKSNPQWQQYNLLAAILNTIRTLRRKGST
ncbi:hypothetical protein EVAR_70722_1 [Eumeta japonica]|uniref:Uncharacterized protein n=1 Tax=Eumeta variegata TaxID=151549 RepID=A0A4C1TEQ2_EUMVA|nr:hypothetical protein EVAR_70722_1 [Eumeta japonica]